MTPIPGKPRKATTTLAQERKQLPIYAARAQIVQEIRAHPVVILIGETGSGKLPQYLLEEGMHRGASICVTQPRRVAASSIAKRVAQEQQCELGTKIGYRVRFDDQTSPATRVHYITDGILMREYLTDPLLRKYSVIVLDEAHERSLRTDILFGMVKRILKQRQDLRIVIMSATMDADKFAAFFHPAKILYVEGRQHPVRILCAPQPLADYHDATLVTIFQIHQQQKMNRGDMLVFLTGQEEIELLEKSVLEYAKDLPANVLKLIVCPLFSGLPSHLQSAVFEPTPSGCRKVILATNIAETSITISGVRTVIDCGLQKVRGFKMGLDTLVVEPISKASARQRAGRAGREAPGTCYRLYTEQSFHELAENEFPEIQRCDLAGVVLLLKATGIDDMLSFDFMDPPPQEALIRALENLYLLGAFDQQQNLTPLGKQMAGFPLEPELSKILITSKDFGCTREIIAIISLLSTETVFHSPSDRREEAAEARKKFLSSDGDMLTYLNVFRSYLAAKKDKRWCRENFVNSRAMNSALDIQKQLQDFCVASGTIDPDLSCAYDLERVLRCLLSGFAHNIALLQPDGNTYKCVATNQQVHIHPSSVLFQKKAEAVLFQELVFTSRRYIRKVSRISPDWLLAHYDNNNNSSSNNNSR